MKNNMKFILTLCGMLIMLFSAFSAFSAEVTLYVTRHGKTMFNTVHRVQGWSDTPLTKAGLDVAEQLGKGLKGIDFTAVYSSDLGRARETARVVLSAKGDSQQIIEMPEFRETCFGSFEGDLDENMWGAAGIKLGYKNASELLTDAAKNKIPLAKIVDTFKTLDKSGMGEDYSTVTKRMVSGLNKVAQDVQKKGGGNVLIVTHGMALVAMANQYLDKQFTGQVKNASVTKIRYTDDGKFIVESLGDTSYIEKGKQ